VCERLDFKYLQLACQTHWVMVVLKRIDSNSNVELLNV